MLIRALLVTAVAALIALPGCKPTTLQEAAVTHATYGIEAQDWDVPATRDLRQDSFHAPTPLAHPEAAVITTRDLHARLIGPNPPLLIDVQRGTGHSTLPGTIWLPMAGSGGSFQDDVQSRLASILEEITGSDPSRPVVVFCLSSYCWLSYNAALRFHNLGYENVFWYRGGTDAWKEANLPTEHAVAYKP